MSNQIKLEVGSSITFASGSNGFNPSNLATNTGLYSDRYDLGAAPRAYLYTWRAKTQGATAPVIGTSVDIFLATTDNDITDGGIGSGTATFTNTDLRRNFQYVGSLTADVNSVSGIYNSGLTTIYARQIQPIYYNNLGVSLSTQSGVHSFVLTPVYEAVQS
jgi:hypothetical protein